MPPASAIKARRPNAPVSRQPIDDASIGQLHPTFTAQVKALAIGEHAMRHVAVDEGHTLATITEMLPDWREGLRDTTGYPIRQAKKDNPKAAYSTEVSDLHTGSGRLFIVAIITRTA